jgi:predicted dehydrogenase
MESRHIVRKAKTVRIAIIGYGFMGRVHSYAFRVASMMRSLSCEPRLTVLCGRKEEEVRRAATSYGFDEWSTDWRSVVERADIDIVDVCTPPGHHAEVVQAAAEAGKAIICEKPLAETYASASRAARAVTQAGVLNASIFNYRHLPAVTLMHQLMFDGAVGEPLLWRAIWLGDEYADPSIPFDWRFDLPFGGSTILDLGAHAVDLARWMVGEVDEVVAQSATFITTRPSSGVPSVPVTVDDASAALAQFAGGARGVFEFAKVCHGRPTDFSVEVNGRDGTLIFDYAHLNELWLSSAHDEPRQYGIRRIRAEHPPQPYANNWWPAALGLGYEAGFIDEICNLLERWPDGPWSPDLNNALKTQAVCVAMERSASTRSWVRVSDVEAEGP